MALSIRPFHAGVGTRMDRSPAGLPALHPKTPWLWLGVLGVWIGSLLLFQLPLLDLLRGSLTAMQRLSLFVFLGWIDYAWLCCVYQLALSIAGTLREPRARLLTTGTPPPVAILYTTMNDFSEDAVRSCVGQDYKHGFHVFILDDSTSVSDRADVDRFHSSCPRQTTVIRRITRDGYKAGNLNHALKHFGSRFSFVALCDADGVLPPNFLTRTMAHFADDTVGFVQAAQRATSASGSGFVQALAISVEIYWERIVAPLERFGFLMFHGHGGVIRTKVLDEIGGFPTIVCEDLGFSTLAREHGYVGVLARDVVCEEAFPSSYEAFARRRLKYVRGGIQHLTWGLRRFLWSRRIPWFERLDRLFASVSLMSGLPLLLFLANVVLALPAAFGSDWVLVVAGANGDAAGTQRHVAFYVITIMSLVAPLVPAALHMRREPTKLVAYIAVSVAVHVSLLMREAAALIVFAVTKRVSFEPTGARVAEATKAKGSSDTASEILIEVGLTTACVVGACVNLNGGPAILPLICAAMLRFSVTRFGWHHGLSKVMMPLPVVAISLLIALQSLSLVGLCGMFFPVAFAALY